MIRYLFLQFVAILPFAVAFSPATISRATTSCLARHQLHDNIASASVTMNIQRRASSLTISMASSDDATSQSVPRKKRKRKDGKQFSPLTADVIDEESESSTSAPKAEEKKEEEQQSIAATSGSKKTSVVMKVRDIRDVISGAPETTTDEEDDSYIEEDADDELADDEEWEYYDVDEDGNEIIVSNDDAFMKEATIDRRSDDDSLEQLLADARSMRASSSDGKSTSSSAEGESSIKDKVFDAISTIVTIDFFVVIGLLVWFLAGIFCSTVLKDDTVQIAFNMNFEKVTQPALGILMIGSIAGSLGNKDEEEE